MSFLSAIWYSLAVNMSFDKLPAPIKSQSDAKNYRHIKLPNGLQALLISDVDKKNYCKDENENGTLFFEQPEDCDLSGKLQ